MVDKTVLRFLDVPDMETLGRLQGAFLSIGTAEAQISILGAEGLLGVGAGG